MASTAARMAARNLVRNTQHVAHVEESKERAHHI
jgi:hypothetical protein